VKEGYVTFHALVGDTGPLLTLVRVLLATLVLLIPTSLIGATLPLILRSSLFRAEQLGTRAGLLYATNTAGAVAGVLLAGFHLIPSLGLAHSFELAAGLNGIVAAAAGIFWITTHGHTEASRHTESHPFDTALPTSVVNPGSRRLVLIVFAISGFASLALEVIWFRVLVIFLGPTVYAFSIMLATVLAGIALGSAVVTPWLARRRTDWLALLALVQIAIAVAALLSFDALAVVQPAAAYVEVASDVRPAAGYLALAIAGSIAAIAPTTILLGVAFPIGVRLFAAEDSPTQAASRVGLFYAVNTCGAIAGPLAAAFWLLPTIGSRGAVIAVASLSLASALALLADVARRRPRFAATAAAAGAIVFLIATGRVLHALDSALARVYRSEQILWREEGVQATVKVNARPSPDGRPLRVLYVNGWHQANDSPGTLYLDRLIGVLPVALHRDPHRALVVGLGGGATAGAIARFPGVDVTVVELSPSVVRAAAQWFGHANFDLLTRPNTTLRIDDGRNYVLLTSDRYDVLTADVIVPRHSEAANLYSVEYFQQARRVLKPDGVMLQWLPTGTEFEYRTIMRTFLSVFPDATLWARGSLLVGTPGPLSISRMAFERRLADPATRAALDVVGLSAFETLLTLYDAGPEELKAYIGSGPILTDDKPLIEYFLSRDRGDGGAGGSPPRGDVLRHVVP
jgi:spermidine synthase